MSEPTPLLVASLWLLLGGAMFFIAGVLLAYYMLT